MPIPSTLPLVEIRAERNANGPVDRADLPSRGILVPVARDGLDHVFMKTGSGGMRGHTMLVEAAEVTCGVVGQVTPLPTVPTELDRVPDSVAVYKIPEIPDALLVLYADETWEVLPKGARPSRPSMARFVPAHQL